MTKIDLKKEMAALYGTTPRQGFVIVDVPALNYLMIDGQGDPNTAKSFSDAIEALYGMSYTLKFMIKKGGAAIDYGVMPLEALWWTDDMADFSMDRKDKWKWTAMILQPKWVTAAMVAKAKADVAKKKAFPALEKVRFERFKEGKAAQCLYVGPYADEPPMIEKLHVFIASKGKRLSGKHHEIYLNDARRTAPAKLKTIIRQPMAG